MTTSDASAAPIGATVGRDEIEAALERAAQLVQSSPGEAVRAIERVCADALMIGEIELTAHGDYLLARAQVNVGDLDSALESIDRAHAHFLSVGATVDALRTGLGRMHVLDDRGRHRDAIEVGRRLLSDIEQLDEQHRHDPAVIRLAAAAEENIGVASGSLGNHLDALAAYEHAVGLYDAAGLEIDAARCGANRGVELFEMGRADEAIAAFASAAPAFVDDDDTLFAGLCAAYEAAAHAQRGDFLRAHQLNEQSAQRLADLEISTEFARAQRVRAETLIALNLVDDALSLYDGLVERFTAAGLRHEAALADFGRASALLLAGRTRDATGAFERCEKELDEIGDRPTAALSRLGRTAGMPVEEQIAVARDVARLEMELGRNADEAIVRLRLATLLTELDRPDLTAEIESQLARIATIVAETKLPSLAWQLDFARATLAVQRGDDDAARERLLAAERSIESMRDTVADERSRVPFMGSRRRVHEALIALHLRRDDVEGALERTTRARARTLLERSSAQPHGGLDPGGDWSTFDTRVVYEIIDDEIIAFVSTPEQTSVVRDLCDVATLRRLAGRLGAQWRRFHRGPITDAEETQMLASTIDVLHDLHRHLLEPLPSLDRATGIVFVPIGAMANIPFAALHDGTSYLLDRCRVAVAASIDLAPPAVRDGARRLLIGVGDEAAPMVAAEVAAIARLGEAETTTMLDDDATAEAMLSAAPDHDIVHIACHGVHRADNPALSALQFADRDVTAIELSSLDLDGQLVLLSACSSGRQSPQGSLDELLGLPRAFLAAGARDVIVNLWPVDDVAARELMSDLHSRLGDSNPIDALRDAQIDLKSRRPHPYHWAPTMAYVNTFTLGRTTSPPSLASRTTATSETS